jgi:hypothetical protein
MAEEDLEKVWGKTAERLQIHSIEPGTFALDLYRPICMVLADRQVAGRAGSFYHPIAVLQGTYLRAEVTRILISSAAGLRILFDQHPELASNIDPKTDCGKLFSNWPAKTTKPEVLRLRAACNKIIHATQVKFDVVIPDADRNPDEEGIYLRPYLYLYGERNGVGWRAVLSIIDFAKWGAQAFQSMMR